MESLYEKVIENAAYDCRKHGLASDPESYARDLINAMSNTELLDALSIALDDMLNGEKK